MEPLALAIAFCLGGLVGVFAGVVWGRRWSGAPEATPNAAAAEPDADLPDDDVTSMPSSQASPLELAYDEAVDAGQREGWRARLPRGAQLSVWFAGSDDDARRAARALEDEARHGIGNEEDVFRRQLAVQRVWQAAAALAEGHGLELMTASPRAVGPNHHETWIVDEGLARRVGVLLPGGFVQPRLVLRPAVLRGGRVLLEGLVV